MIVILFFENSLMSEQTQIARVAGFYLRHSISIGTAPVRTIESGPESRLAHILCLEPHTPILCP